MPTPAPRPAPRRRRSGTLALSVLALLGVLAATRALLTPPRPRPCPGAVTFDGRIPRDARGRVRECWPGEARCACDARGDCWARTGYRACAPRKPPPGDAGVSADAAACPSDASVVGVPVATTTVTVTTVVGTRDAGP